MIKDFNLSLKTEHYINGCWQQDCQTKEEKLVSFAPATQEVLWEGAMATKKEVEAAFEAAHNALKTWSVTSLETRISHLQRFAGQVKAKQEEFAQLIAHETGKPLWEAYTEVSAVIGKIDISIQAYHERTAFKTLSVQDASGYLRYKPHGVIAVLGPFNFPAHLSNGHIVPALLGGNTLIFKPSELTPAVAQWMVQQWHDAGLPKGVLNCVHGGADVGKHVLECPIQGVFFTGSYRTGLHIHQMFSGKPQVLLALEMGGNNPLILDEVNDLKAAIYHTLLSAFITAGQRCSCARRLLIPNTQTGKAFLDGLVNATKHLKIGHPTAKPTPFLGPVISKEQASRLLNAQNELLDLGAMPLLQMKPLPSHHAFLKPGILDMTAARNVPDEELFGPILQIYRYDTFEEALHLANQTKYGLSAGLLSDNASHFRTFYQEIRAGIINWNRPLTGASSHLPFGGIGCSGNHRPSAYFAADYCAYPVASLEHSPLSLPTQCLPGIELE